MKYLHSEAGLPIQILAWETGPPHGGRRPKGGGQGSDGGGLVQTFDKELYLG